MKKRTKRMIKRIIALLLALLIVVSFGLYHASDRILQAEAIPEEMGSVEEHTEEVLAEAPEAPPVETVEITLPPEPVPEIVTEPVPEPVPEVVMEAVPEPAPEIVTEPVPEPVPEQVIPSEPVPEPVPAPEAAADASAGMPAETAVPANEPQSEAAAAEDTAGQAIGTEKEEALLALSEEEEEEELVIVSITGHSSRVEYNGAEQSVSGFDFTARLDRDGTDVTGNVRVVLADGTAALAAGTDPGTYAMELFPGQFNVSSDLYTEFEVRIVRDGTLDIEESEAPENETPESEQDDQNDAVTEEETITEEQQSSGTSVTEETEERDADSEEDAGTDEEVSSEEESAEDETKEEEAAEEESSEEEDPEEAEQEEEERPAQSISCVASDGAVISVSAPAGALPDGAYVPAYVASSDEARSAIEAILDDGQEVVSVVVYDITIHDRDGNEIQPDSTVSVSISGASLGQGQETGLYHISDEGSASKVSDLSGSSDASFSTDHFSKYAVASTQNSDDDHTDGSGTIRIAVGESVILIAPEGFSGKTVSWTSSNTSIASVSSTGEVTGVKPGNAVITFAIREGVLWNTRYTTEATYDIEVVPAAVLPGIKVDRESLSFGTIGETRKITAQLQGMEEENTIIWTTSDPSVATVENGVVTACGSGNCIITAEVRPEEDELYGNMYSATTQVSVAFNSYTLYHYALVPGASKDSGRADDNWFGLGMSYISGVTDPTKTAKGVYSGSYQIGAEIKALYPDLVYEGKTYSYAAAGSENAGQGGYYTVQPFRVVVANGANTGKNGYNGTTGVRSYHLDYICVLNEETYSSVSFAVMFPGETAFNTLTSVAERVVSGSSESRIGRPSAGDVPASMVHDGVTYVFDGWYRDAACTEVCDFSGSIDANTTFYGRYVPQNAFYRVEYYYDGVLDDSLTSVLGPVRIGTVVSDFAEKPKNGFTKSGYEPVQLTVSADIRDNTVRIYYTKRLVSYFVNCRLYGTGQDIAPARKMSIRMGETVSVQRPLIDGYTPVGADSGQSAVITGDNQEITFYYRKNVILTADDVTVQYDGSLHTASGWSQSEAGPSFDGIRVSGSGRNAGSYTIAFEQDYTGSTDPTGAYIISSCRNGTLTVEPLEVTVAAADAGKVFGSDDPELTASEDGLVNGDTLEYTLRREAGEAAGSYRIIAEGPAEQGSYHVVYMPGTFTITEGELPLAALSLSKKFDGLPLEGGVMTGLPEGTAVEFSIDGGASWSETAPSITDAGILEYSVRAVHDNYAAAEAAGRLEIVKRSIIFRSSDAVREYNGIPLTTADQDAQGIIVSGDGFAQGEGASFTLTGSQLLPGISANTFTYQMDPGTSESNYDISVQEGTLNVTDRENRYSAVLEANSGTYLYDGSVHTAAGLKDLTITADGKAYTVSGVEAYAEGQAAGTYDVHITGVPMITDKDGNDVTSQFSVTLRDGTLTIGKRNLVMTSASSEKEYDGEPLSAAGVYVTGDGFADGEGAEYSVTGRISIPGAAANTFDYAFTDGTDPSNYDVTKKEGTLTVRNRDAKYSVSVKAAGRTVLYDGTEQIAEELTGTAFAIGETAYTISGLSAWGSGTHAGKYPVRVFGTPVVTDPEGNDVTDQFSVEMEDAVLEIIKRHVILTSADGIREYDGLPLTEDGISVSGDGFADSEGYTAIVTGTRTTEGTSPNAFEYTLNGNTSADDYEIETRFGELTVTGREQRFPVTVTANSGSFLYDGNEHSISGFERTTYVVNGQLYSLDGITAEATAVKAGVYTAAVTGQPVITDAAGNDVTAQFEIHAVPGELKIAKRNVTIRSASVTKQYDGSALTACSVDISGDGFAEGEGAEYAYTGSRTLPGASPNLFEYTLAAGTDAANYSIETSTGMLTVTDRDVQYEVSLRAKSATYVYDGTERSVSGFESTEFEADGHHYTLQGVEAAAAGKNAGSYMTVIQGEPSVLDESGNDVTAQFMVNIVPGELHISRRRVSLVSGSASAEYNGRMLTSADVKVEGDGFAEGEGAEYTVTGGQLLTGQSLNLFSYVLNENTSAENYDITVTNGILRVLPRQEEDLYRLTLEAESGSFLYDGTVHSVSGIRQTAFEVEGNTYTVTGAAAFASARQAGDTAVDVTGDFKVLDGSGNDVSDQFVIDTVSGLLHIGKRHVLLTSADATAVYTGRLLTAGEVTIGGDGFAEGEGAGFVVTGSRVLAGTVPNSFSYVLNEGTNAENYEIEVREGLLTVRGRTEEERPVITVRAADHTVKYDGHTWEVSGLVGTVFELDGVTYSVEGLSASASEAAAGEYGIEVSGTAVVRDPSGNDVTDQFNVVTQPGLLTVEPRDIVLTSASAEREFDGSALTAEQVVVSGDGFAEGDGASYVFTGARTVPGSGPNAFGYTLEEGTTAENYNIDVQFGTLTVTDRAAAYEILVESVSGEYLYDGTLKEADGLVSSAFTVDGHLYTVEGLTAHAEGAEAGIYRNRITGDAAVKDAEGNDVTGQFLINTSEGQLVIRRRTIVLTSASVSAEYDGQTLSAEEITEGGDGFAEGEGAAYVFGPGRSLPGSSENRFTFDFNDGTDPDNYQVQTVFGTITVLNRGAAYAITVKANSRSVLYDGSEQQAEGLETSTFDIDGHTYTVTGLTASASGISAGQYPVNITGTCTVMDASGNDVTDQFAVSTENGMLTISPRKVILTSVDAAKEYDGTPLADERVIVSGDGFAEGEGAVYSFSGTRTLVGSTDNAFTYQLKSNTEARNYDVSTVFGDLAVTDRGEAYAITVKAAEGDFLYDGQEKSADGFVSLVFNINGQDYTVEGLTAYGAGTDAGTYPVSVSGRALVTDPYGNDVTGQFTVKTEEGSLVIRRRNVVLTSADAEMEYDGSALTDFRITVGGDGFAEGEGADFHATGTRTVPGSSDNIFEYSLKEGTKAENYDIQVVTGTLLVTNRNLRYEIVMEPVGMDVLYDGSLKEVSGFRSNTFRIRGRSFTVEGISAGVSATDAGEYDVTVTGTPRILDQEGSDVTDQFTVSVAPEKLVIRKRNVILRSSDTAREYDGSPLTSAEVQVGGDGFAAGEGAAYEFTGSRTAAGTSLNTFSYTLNEGTDPDNYSIRSEYGSITVLNRSAKYSIIVEAADLETVYDGRPHTASGLVSASFTVEGRIYHVAGLTAERTETNAGTYEVAVVGEPVVTDTDGNDVTGQFIVNVRNGMLHIRKRNVILTSADAVRVYDGSSVTAQEVRVSGDGFAEGEGASYSFSGTRTVTGSSGNTFSYTLNEGTDAGNYEIETRFGQLTVTSRPEEALYEADVYAAGGVFLYDGRPHTVSGITADGQTGESVIIQAGGHEYTLGGLTSELTETDAGTYRVNISGAPEITDEAGEDVTDQFIVRLHSNELVIVRRKVVLTSGSASRPYNGRVLAEDSVSVGGAGFAEGEGASFHVFGSRMLTGESENSFTYELLPGTRADNYDISTVFGTLSVTNRDARYRLTVTAASRETVYDGSMQQVSGLVTDHFVLEGMTYSISGLTAGASHKDAGTYPVPITGTPVVKDAEGNDVSSQFMIETVPGTLKIGKRKIVLGSDDVAAPYSGSAISGGEVRILEGSFAEGEGITCQMTGSRILTGISPNSFTYSFNPGTREENYDISVRTGSITVLMPDAAYEIVLRPAQDEVPYDGREHTVSGFEQDTVERDGNTYTVTGLSAGVSATEPGIYPVTVSGRPIVLDEAGNDVTDHFAVTVEEGFLKISGVYPLIIRFVDQNGEPVAPEFRNEYAEGEPFGPVAVPEVEELVPEVRSVSSSQFGMPGREVALEVTYQPAAGASDAESLTETGTVTPPAGRLTLTVNGEVRLDRIEEEEIPLARLPFGYGYWALFNLIAALLSVLICVILLIAYFGHDRQESEADGDDDDGFEIVDLFDTVQEDDSDDEKRAKLFRRIASFIPAAASVIMFILTEDMTRSMRLADRWSGLMLLLLLVQLIIAWACRRKKEPDHRQSLEKSPSMR